MTSKEITLLCLLFLIAGLLIPQLIESNSKNGSSNNSSSTNLIGYWSLNSNAPVNYSEFEKGEWVFIKVSDLNYSECVNVGRHECGHSLYNKLNSEESYNKTESEDFADGCEY